MSGMQEYQYGEEFKTHAFATMNRCAAKSQSKKKSSQCRESPGFRKVGRSSLTQQFPVTMPNMQNDPKRLWKWTDSRCLRLLIFASITPQREQKPPIHLLWPIHHPNRSTFTLVPCLECRNCRQRDSPLTDVAGRLVFARTVRRMRVVAANVVGRAVEGLVDGVSRRYDFVCYPVSFSSLACSHLPCTYNIHQMCFEESIEAKAAPAVGFPPGWRFYFAEAKTWTSCSKHKQIPTLWVISPSGKAYRSAEAGIEHKGLDGGKRIVRQFYKHVGLPVNNESQIQETRRESVTGQWSLSKNRVVGSRAYCTTKKKWGIIEKKFQLGKDKFRYSVKSTSILQEFHGYGGLANSISLALSE